MKIRTAFFAVLSILFVCAFPAVSLADTVFSNIGSGYSSVHGLSVNDVAPIGPLSETNSESASLFTVASGSGFDLTQIDIALVDDNIAGGITVNDIYDVKLMTNSSGLPGTVLHTWTLTNVPADDGSVTTIQSSQIISGITGITLTGNTTYWLAAFPHQLGTQGKWMEPTVDNGTFANSTNFGTTWSATTFTEGAFDILGTPATAGGSPVPEPSSILLFSSGAAGLFGVLRRKLPLPRG